MAAYTYDFTGTGALSADWETANGSGLVRISDEANAATSGQHAASTITTAARTFDPDQYAQIAIPTFSASDWPGVVLRGSNSGGGLNGYVIRGDTSGSYRGYRSVNGTLTSIIYIGTAPVSTDVLYAEIIDYTIKVYINTVLVKTFIDSDAAKIATGQPGIYYRYDNNNASRIDDFEADDLGASIGPVFTQPDPISSREGDDLSLYPDGGVDASAWFTSAETITYSLDGAGSVLPDGTVGDDVDINASTGLITGTLDEAATAFAATVQATDVNGTTDGDFTWNISELSLDFTGTKKLLNTSNSPYSGTVNFSAIKGTIDTSLTGSVIEFPLKTVTDGVVTLADTGLSLGTWTVLAQDNVDATIIGVYEITIV